MLRAVKIRLYPNKEQTTMINKLLGCCRVVYNQCLNRKIESYKNEGKVENLSTLGKFVHHELLKDDNFIWLREHNTKVLKQAVKDMLSAYKNFFERHSVYPKFKTKHDNKQSCKSALEAINEKSVDNSNKIVNSKFKVGDWVVRKDGRKFCNGYKFAQITEIDGEKHWFDTDITYKPEDIRLWTIADAKDGDVLVASDGSIFIFAGVVDYACKYYAALTLYNGININKEVELGSWELSNNVHPATKEQCDLLFAKMRERGYKWNNEKKEVIGRI